MSESINDFERNLIKANEKVKKFKQGEDKRIQFVKDFTKKLYEKFPTAFSGTLEEAQEEALEKYVYNENYWNYSYDEITQDLTNVIQNRLMEEKKDKADQYLKDVQAGNIQDNNVTTNIDAYNKFSEILQRAQEEGVKSSDGKYYSPITGKPIRLTPYTYNALKNANSYEKDANGVIIVPPVPVVSEPMTTGNTIVPLASGLSSAIIEEPSDEDIKDKVAQYFQDVQTGKVTDNNVTEAINHLNQVNFSDLEERAKKVSAKIKQGDVDTTNFSLKNSINSDGYGMSVIEDTPIPWLNHYEPKEKSELNAMVDEAAASKEPTEEKTNTDAVQYTKTSNGNSQSGNASLFNIVLVVLAITTFILTAMILNLLLK